MNIIRGQLKTLGGVAFIVGLVLFFAGLNSPRALAGTIYVDADATLGVKDGSDWENAFTNINAALAVAVAGDEIWVAEGTYTGAVTLKQGVGVYGGFNGTEESRDERDFDQYITTISNNQDGPTVTGVNGSKIDGCTITHATGNNGSGIRCYQVAVTIENNHIKGNNTLSDGGGIYCNDGAPIIVNNRIEGNFAEAGYGGGIFLRNVTSSEAMVSNNIIELNSAKRGAGLCAFYDNSVTVKNNLIRFNHATVRGGGAWLGQGCISNIMNNVIAWNRAYSGGGGLYCERSSVGLPMIINNTFFVNTTDTGLNYGIYCYLAYPTIMNTIIYNYGNAIVDGDSLYFSYNNLNGDDPLFEGPDVLDPVNFDFHLSEGSPDIDTGNPAISDPDGTISDKGAYGGPWAGMIGPDYNPPDLVIEYDPNDPNSYFEQQGPSGTTITFVTTNENGTMFLWGQAEGNSVLIARAWDDDGQSTMLLEPDPNGGLFGPGENILVITVQDSFGHIASDSATLVVSDTVPPVLDEDPLPELTDECSVTVDAAPTATDACVSEPITGTTSDPLVYEEQGTFTITWTYDDGSGNIITQTQTVVVDDTTAPVPDVDPLPDATGQCEVTLPVPTGTDNCGGTVTVTTSDPTTYTDQGTYMVTWTYADENGNSTTRTQTVIVDDTTAPVPDVDPLPDVTVQCEVTLSVPTGTDNCGGTVTVTTSDPTTYTDQGTYMVTWTYADENGNSTTRTQTVIVDDTTAPVPDVDPLPDVTGQCEATVSVPTGTDNCGGAVTVTTNGPTSFTDQGNYMVTWTFTDENGNSTTRTQTVIVDDTTAPVPDVDPLPDVTGQCEATVSVPTGTDNCGGAVTVTTSDPTTYTDQGTYTVTWTYTDELGNSTTRTQTVIVDDTTLPVVDAGANRTVDKGKSVNLQATATDNCTETGNFVYEWREGTTVLGTGASLTRTFGVGTHTVVLSVTDQAGNTGTDTVTVKVKQVTRVQTFPYYFQTFQFPYSFLGTQIPSFQPAILYRPSIPSFYQFPSAYTFPQFQMGQFGTTGYPFYLNFLR